MATAKELPVDTTVSAEGMADAMFGNGVKIVSATYTGAEGASGVFTDGDSVADAITPSDTGVILSTGNAQSITNSSGTSNTNTSAGTTTSHGTAGDADLTEIAGMQTFDAAVLEAEFIPVGDTLSMQVVFGSEEYLEYVNSGFNDAVGIWVNGTKATLEVTDGEISIDSINDKVNSDLYVDNAATDDTYNTEMDGFTVTLTLTAPVKPGEVNTLKIGIADAGDTAYDSNLLIAGDSIGTPVIGTDDTIEVTGDQTQEINVLDNDVSTSGTTLTITHINGQAVSEGSTVTLPSGEVLTVGAGGLLSVTGDGNEGESSFSYTATDTLGNADTSTVTMTTIPCFVAGCMIDTTEGPRPVEQLSPGDLVLTRDHGAQPVVWVGLTRRKAEGLDAPVRISAGALGDHAMLEVSPNHRMLVQSSEAELMFGEAEVLVRAKSLVNDTTITRRTDAAPVTYVHLLFEQHEIVRGNGLWSESYHPGEETMESFDPATRDEIFRLFPLMGTVGLDSYGPTARTALRHYEALALLELANRPTIGGRRTAH